MTIIAGALTFIGAGCGQDQVAIPADRMNSESALSFQPANPADARPAAPAPAVADAGSAAADSAGVAANPPAGSWQRPTSFPGVLPDRELRGKQARIVTAKGVIVFELLDQEAPKAASNFIALARSGFYDGLTFHRVEPGFVIQGGDPLGNGRGDPGYKFDDEPVSLDYAAGIVAMANSGANTNGSQFFVVIEDQPTLPKNYTIFGRVTFGMDVVRRIAVGDVMSTVEIEDKR